MNLAENIYRFRTERNMSQLDLADSLGVSRQSVSKWETGAAVPELDKLVKMANLFDVSLDMLVNGDSLRPRKESTPAEAPEPNVIYVEKPVFRDIKREYIIGGVLLICALIYALILFNGRFYDEETLLMVLPVAACGVVYLLTKHPLFFCGWIGAMGYWTHFFILAHRWEEHFLLTIFGVFLVAAMAFRTIHVASEGIVSIPGWVLAIGGIALLLLLLLLGLNTFVTY